MLLKLLPMLENTQETPTPICTDTILDEAWKGGKVVTSLDRIMEDIVKEIKNDPTTNINLSKNNTLLQDAIKRIFGFKDVEIYWSGSPQMNNGPFTIVTGRLFPPVSIDESTETMEAHYDKKHRYHLIVHMDQNLVSVGDLTAREVVAILLHEIGHNFELGVAGIARELLDYISAVLEALIFSKNPATAASAGISLLTNQLVRTNEGKKLIFLVNTIQDRVFRSNDFLNKVYQAFGKVSMSVGGLLAFLSIPQTIASIPIRLLVWPVRLFSQIGGRGSEQFSDSFAADYGYGAELSSALIKLNTITTYGGVKKKDLNPLLAIMYDMVELEREILGAMFGVHGTHQDRTKVMMYRLNKQLKESKFDPKTKAEIQKEINRLDKIYADYINLAKDHNHKNFMSTAFRQVMDVMYYRITDNVQGLEKDN